MAIAIRPYTEEWIPGVKAFNLRLAAGGIAPEFHFPENHVPHWLPQIEDRKIFQEYYLAVDGEFVRGAFILKHQEIFLHGEMRRVVYYHLPVSEGIVNKAYASVGAHMLRSAMKLQPMLFALGMGGFDRPLPQMLKALGWKLCAVPFYFRVCHPVHFLRQIAPLRQSLAKRFLANLAAFSGVGGMGIKAVQAARIQSALRGVDSEEITGFGPWADELWQSARSNYTLVANRDRITLNVLYPAGKNFLCLKIRRGTKLLGWAVVLDTQMRDNKYFGGLRLGSIADCFAAPEDAAPVIQAATCALEQRGVDLIVSNQMHSAWASALRSSGYLSGPSNFIFGASKPLAEILAPFETVQHLLFFNRGDGDGPVNL